MARSIPRRTLPLLLGLALLPPTLALTGTRPELPFSRARWIVERLGQFRFDGGLIPADPETIGARREAFGPSSKAGSKARRPPVEKSLRVSRDILEPGEGSEPETETETFLAVDPADDRSLLAAYQEGRYSDGGARGLTYAVSSDGGKSWREGVLPGLTRSAGGIYERASDPWVAFGPDHRAYYASLAFDETTPANGIFLSASDDGGRSWGDPVAVHLAAGGIDDKEAVIADARSDSPFRGRVYVAWDSIANGLQTLYLSSSDDHGQTFSTPLAIETRGQNLGVIPLVGPHGVLHLIWGQGLGRQFLLKTRRSDDGGATWSDALTLGEARNEGVASFRSGDGLPAAAIDPQNGDLYVTWQDARFTPGVDQAVYSHSFDGGATWSPAARLSDGPADAANFTPAVAVDRNGRVGICYHSLRNDPERRFLLDLYCRFSRKRRGPFKAGTRINTVSFDARDAALVDRGFFLGDYAGMGGTPLGFNPLFIATLSPSAIDPGHRQPDAFTRQIKP